MVERRKAERLQIYLDAKWEGILGFSTGTIGDMSTGGCYVMTGGNVKEKELIRLEIQLPTEELLLWGEVHNWVPEIGFGLRFTMLDDEARTAIEKLFNHARERDALARARETEGNAAENAAKATPRALPGEDVTNISAGALSSPEVDHSTISTSHPPITPEDLPSVTVASQKANENGLEITQLRELPAPTKKLIDHTLSKLRQLITAFETADEPKQLEASLASWFKLAEGCIGVLPYGELRRSLRNVATIIRHAYDLHAENGGMIKHNSTARYIEENYRLEGIPASERPAYLIKTFVFSYHDLAVKIGRDAEILQSNQASAVGPKSI